MDAFLCLNSLHCGFNGIYISLQFIRSRYECRIYCFQSSGWSVALSPSVERLYIKNFLDKVTRIIYLANRSVAVCLSELTPQYFYTQKDPQTGFSAEVQF